MKVYHISAECYPVAKVGGLGDVVGALPKYQNLLGIDSAVIMPWYDKPFVRENEFEKIYESEFKQGTQFYSFAVLKGRKELLGFDIFLIKIPGLLDRAEVYGYSDEISQFLAFQHALLHWISKTQTAPSLFHCHDHHSGLIPFFIENCNEFKSLKGIPTLATVHNGQYQGWMDWGYEALMPPFDSSKGGLLDWNQCINPLAALIKSCWAYNTVSSGYLQELFADANGLEKLFSLEKAKGHGVINGIDDELWNPKIDPFLAYNYDYDNLDKREKNKEALCATYGLDPNLPLLVFIGRLALEKGADLLPGFIQELTIKFKNKINFLVLGSGDSQIEDALIQSKEHTKQNLAIIIGYNEKLAHQLYASVDFLIMPSRIEPCGLNQLYAMRYGTIPIVRKTGGLKDTVIDLGRKNSNGIVFKESSLKDMIQAIRRALKLYKDLVVFNELRKENMKLDYSWNSSATKYVQLYRDLTNHL